MISDESEEESGIVQKSDQPGNEGSKSTDLEACSSMSTIPSDSGTDKAMIEGSSGISQKESDANGRADCDKPAAKIHLTAPDGKDSCTGVASCRGDVYHWKPGDYTLASDSDPEVGECALDAILYFCCEGICICTQTAA